MSETAKIIAENLVQARVAQKKSQLQVAQLAGISRAAYQKIEKGISTPLVDTLESLANALGLGIMDLVTRTPTLSRVRFRSSKKMKTRKEILARVARWLRDFNEVEGLLGERIDYVFSGLGANLLDGYQYSGLDLAKRAAELARERAGLDKEEPILDICGLLESNGVKVYSLSVASEDFYGLSVAEPDGGPAVVANVWERLPVERWIFSSAHELGHLILHLESFDVNQADESPSQENEASLFASHFLMPETAFDKFLKRSRGLGLIDWVFKFKRIYGVSYKTVLIRLIERGLVDKSVWRRFNFYYRARFGKTLRFKEEPRAVSPNQFAVGMLHSEDSGEPSRLDPSDFIEDRLSGLVRKALEQEKISISRAAQILDSDLADMKELAAWWGEINAEASR